MKKFPNLKNPFHFFASLGGIGCIPIAPGTFGSFFSAILFIVISHHLDDMLIPTIVSIVFSILVCEIASKDLANKDHKAIVIDELAGMWVAVCPIIYFENIGMHERLIYVFICFLLFRFFDITKPFPISFFDTRIKNGFGIVMDDVVAGCFAGLISVLILYFLF